MKNNESEFKKTQIFKCKYTFMAYEMNKYEFWSPGDIGVAKIAYENSSNSL